MAQYLRSLYRFRSQVVMDQRAFTMLYASEQLDYGTYISDYPTTHEIGLGVSERVSDKTSEWPSTYFPIIGSSKPRCGAAGVSSLTGRMKWEGRDWF